MRNHPLLKHLLLPALLLALLLPFSPSTVAAAAGKSPQPQPLLAKRYQMAKARFHNLIMADAKGHNPAAWQELAKRFNAIANADRSKTLVPGCLFFLAELHEEQARRFGKPAEFGTAITLYRELADRFPRHPLADDALLAMGRIYQEDKKDLDAAGRTYARLVALYPDGDQYQEAASRLRELKEADMAAPSSRPGAPAAAEAAPVATAAHPASSKVARPAGTAAPSTPHAAAKAQAPPDAAPSLGDMATLQPLKHWSNNDYTRIVIETSKEIDYRKSLLPRNGDLPRRLYIDLANCRLTPDLALSMPIGDGLLRRVRTAQFSPDTVRVVLDIESISDYKIFTLSDPFRVVIDVTGDRSKEEKRQARKTVKDHVEPGRKLPDSAPSLARQLGLGIHKVVIDPGHGGKDPGAISPFGVMEKDVTLAVAKQVAAILRDQLHCQVVMTRDRDVFVPLEERTAIANTSKGDLFLSIHVNSAPQPDVRGIETYFLDLARGKDAMEVAARENATSAGQMSNLQSILTDLMQSTKINESAKLAECVQEKMISGLSCHYKQIHDLGVKRAPFVVLIGAQMPSVLTEIAFLSNPIEARRLKDPQYLTDVAQQIVAGVSTYADQLNLASFQPR